MQTITKLIVPHGVDHIACQAEDRLTDQQKRMGKTEWFEAIRNRLTASLPWILIGLGTGLRLRQFLMGRSLGHDESLLALNIIERSLTELAKPLDYSSAAPIGFLMVEKLLIQSFGNNEYALRVFPFLAGVMSLILFYEVTKRCVGQTAVLIGLGLFAFSEPLIVYSSELKQYSSDVAIGLFLYLLGLFYLSQDKLSYPKLILLGVAGPLAVFFSHPAVFILAGVGIGLIAADLRAKKWGKMSQLSVICSLWLFGFAILYMTSFRSLANNHFFVRGWRNLGAFMPLLPSSVAEFRWFASNFFETFRYPVGLPLAGLAALAFVTGCGNFLKNNKQTFLLLIAPILFTLLASGLHKYPFRGRLLLFLVPPVLVIIAKGVETIIAASRQNIPILGVATSVLLFFHPLFYATQHLLRPQTTEEMRPVVQYIKERKGAEDTLYIYYGAQFMFKYYQGKYGFSERDYIVGIRSRNDVQNYIRDLEKLRGRDRVWFVFAHSFSRRGVDERTFYLHYLDNVGTRLDAFERFGAAVYLYDLTERPGLETPAGWRGFPNGSFRQSSFRQ